MTYWYTYYRENERVIKCMLLTIDSGGSKTKLLIWDNNKNKILEKKTVGFATAEDTNKIDTALFCEITDFCKYYIIEKVICNLGGKNKNQITKTIKEALPGVDVKVFRESEGLIGITLCKKMDAQVALLAGTGSIAIASYKKYAVICGGWGANIGDKGSGYDLGLQAILTSLKQLDNCEPLSDLAKEITGLSHPPILMSVEEYCNLRDEVRSRIGPFDRAHVAKYAKIVTEFARLGDSHALSLFKELGYNLADLVLCAVNKTKEPLKRVVITGGLVFAKEFWQEAFENQLRQKYDFEQVVYLTDGVDDAMYLLSLN